MLILYDKVFPSNRRLLDSHEGKSPNRRRIGVRGNAVFPASRSGGAGIFPRRGSRKREKYRCTVFRIAGNNTLKRIDSTDVKYYDSLEVTVRITAVNFSFLNRH